MKAAAPAIGWGMFGLAALAASAAGAAGQLGFAVLAIAGLGLAHGASDAALVPRGRQPAFLATYIASAGTCLAAWIIWPALALPLFLLASALHFGLEDAPADRPVERLARGTLMVTGPAVIHQPALTDILHLAGGDAASAALLADGMAAAGLLALAGVGVTAAARRDPRLAIGAAGLVMLPPLVGFSFGFVLLHAGPQTVQRVARLGHPSILAYCRATAPVLAGALLVSLLAVLLFRHADASGLRALFAGLAALAMPHMLVTPWFERGPVPRPASPLTRAA